MIIAHISDTHGKFKPLNGYHDIIVHSGDFFPNCGIIDNESKFQINWLQNNIENFKILFKNKKFLFTLGNHDFIPPKIMEEILRDNGIDAYSLNNEIVNIDSYKFYGFPYVPIIQGYWNYERNDKAMKIEVAKAIKLLKGNHIDVLVCHAPLYQILDKVDNEHCGNRFLLDSLIYKLDREDVPKWVLHGHIHESCGIICEHIFNVSNAATTQHNIEIH